MTISHQIILDFLKLLKDHQEVISNWNPEKDKTTDGLIIRNHLIKTQTGLCDNLIRFVITSRNYTQRPTISEIEKSLEILMFKWRDSSGSIAYPVRGYPSDLDAYCKEFATTIDKYTSNEFPSRDIYSFHSNYNLNMWRGAYGERRWALVDYLIGVLEK